MTTAVAPPSTEDPTRVVGRRCLQYVLDVAIVLVPVLVLGVGVGVLCFPHGSLSAIEVFAVVLVLAMFVSHMAGVLLVQIWWPHRHDGRTPAMGWLGLRIVMEDGATPRVSTYVVRFLLQVVDGFLLGIVGIVLMVVSPRHQRLGDMIARTVVVRDRS
jgi:uncharacterized RDD family membrane protein YckC